MHQAGIANVEFAESRAVSGGRGNAHQAVAFSEIPGAIIAGIILLRVFHAG